MEVKFCVTSFIDLLGFSSHLEIGNDLRTNIGKGIIERLNVLEKAIELFKKEQNAYPENYPENIQYRRINDSITLTMDLPEILTPSIGRITKDNFSMLEMRKFFTREELKSYENFKKAYEKKHAEAISDLTKFLGLSSRIHSFVNGEESRNFFPGAKTVISSGFRRSFMTSEKEEDYFSANFSFSNAYIAESNLKGAKLYIDNNILKLLGSNQYSKNLMKLSSFVYSINEYDPFDDNEVDIGKSQNSKLKKGESHEITLFRKKYLFREINSFYFNFIQLFSFLLPYLNDESLLPKLETEIQLFREVYYIFKNPLKEVEIINQELRFSIFTLDLESNIEELKEYILNEKSEIAEKREKEEQERNLAIETSPYAISSTTHNNGS